MSVGWRQGFEGGTGLVEEGAGFGGLLAQAFDDVGGSFADELVVGETGVVGSEELFVFGEVFAEALAFGGNVDLAFIEDGNVEARGTTRVVAGEGSGGDLDAADAGEAG